MLIKILGAASALFLSTTVILSFLYLNTSHKLDALQTAHKALSVDYKQCTESKAILDDSYKITLATIESQREALKKIDDKGEVEVKNLTTYKPKCAPLPIGVKNEVDIDAPLDPEFIRVSEGGN